MDKDASRFWGESALRLLGAGEYAAGGATGIAKAADAMTAAYLERRGDPPFDAAAEFARLFPKWLESAEKALSNPLGSRELTHLIEGRTREAICGSEKADDLSVSIEQVTCLACLRAAADAAAWRPGHGG